MRLPEGCKIIGFIVADMEDVEGDIFWDEHAIDKMTSLQKADIFKDVNGLVNKKYDDAVLEMRSEDD